MKYLIWMRKLISKVWGFTIGLFVLGTTQHKVWTSVYFFLIALYSTYTRYFTGITYELQSVDWAIFAWMVSSQAVATSKRLEARINRHDPKYVQYLEAMIKVIKEEKNL